MDEDIAFDIMHMRLKDLFNIFVNELIDRDVSKMEMGMMLETVENGDFKFTVKSEKLED